MSSYGKIKRCFFCNEQTWQTKRFPSASKPDLQMEWILRQNLDESETTKQIDRHRAVADPRWCLRHFTSPSDDLPKDERIARVRPVSIPTTPPIRTTRPADLVPPSQFNTSRPYFNSQSHGMVDVYGSVSGPPTPSLRDSNKTSPWPFSPVKLDPRDDDWACNDIDEVLPKRFKSSVSTKTTTTVEPEDTDYRNSQVTSQGEEEEIEQEEDDQTRKDLGRYTVVEDECLMRLFKWCEECGNGLDRSLRLCDLAQLLQLDFPSDRTMRKTIREIGSVAIERVFAEWQETVRELAVNASKGDGLQVSIDGQYGDPGYTASTCKVTVIDCLTRLALAGVAMHKGQEGIEGVSCRMESEGALQAILELVENGIEIKTRVGDQNNMVNKKLREHPKTQNIEMLNDWWHVQRPMRKEWWKLVKANPELAPVYQDYFNHLYYVHHKYPNKEDRPRALEVVRSFVKHIQGKHKWEKSDQFQLVTACEHKRLKKKKKGEKRFTLKAGSNELELIENMVFSPRFAKAFLSAASLIDTAINECYHSLSLMYCPKRFACSYIYYKLKMRVSMLHYNSLMLDDLLGTREEIGNTMLMRKGRRVIAIKRKRGLGTHTWREEVMEESIKVREELSHLRAVHRIGIPDDDVFDDLKNWWEEKEMAKFESGYEMDEEDDLDEEEAEDDEE